jgi:hypothetical protein
MPMSGENSIKEPADALVSTQGESNEGCGIFSVRGSVLPNVTT